MNFEGKVVVVTGASRGIGREIALSFGRLGAIVACIATSESSAAATASVIAAEGGRAHAFGCDVGNSAVVEATFDQIQKELGVPLALVNNAGITRDTLIVRMKDEDWDRVLEVNLKGAFLCTRAVAKSMMKARAGRIVNVSSIIGSTGAAGQANYAASKAGLTGLTKSVAKELGSRGVTCNAVAPGFIETDMTDTLPQEMKDKVIASAPAGRLGTAQDVAAAVLFLASDEAAYITGQVLTVDGGLTL